MRSAKTRSFAIALTLGSVFLGLSACGGMRWHKPGTDDAELTKDLGECRRTSQTRLGIAGSVGPPTSVDPRFGGPSGPSQADLMMQESQALGFCMRDKGYVLEPDKK